MPKVSVIIPVYNSENRLEECLQRVLNQTLDDIEIICVNDSSEDSSLQILDHYAKTDSRITVLSQGHAGAGKAGNMGFSIASGEYACFSSPDCLFEPDLLEKAVACADAAASDMVVFDFLRLHEDGTEEYCDSLRSDWLTADAGACIDISTFSYKDCPDRILSMIAPVSWNKLYRADFLRQNSLQYEELSSAADITFAAVSAARAGKISWLNQCLVKYRVGRSTAVTSAKPPKLQDVIQAVSSAVRQVNALPWRDSIQNAIRYFETDNYIFAFEHYVPDFCAQESQAYYEYIHTRFSGSEFESLNMEDLGGRHRWSVFQAVRRYSYEDMKLLKSRRIIISLTSYPARIHGLSAVLESIYAQTLQPDLITLWLAGEQFPGSEASLPEYLLKYQEGQRLNICWCDDLQPHKKYFYVMQEYPNDLIVTIDDDIIYPKDMLQKLYDSYLLFPTAVSAMRTHLITVSKTDETVLPYRCWIKEADAFIHEPSMYLLATGGAGTLYPPGVMDPCLFDKQAVLDTCLHADDLWLKTMQLLNNTPVVLATEYNGLNFVAGSQAEALYKSNENRNENDLQLSQIMQWLNAHFEKQIWYKKLTQSGCGRDLSDVVSMCECFSRLHERLKQINRESGQKLKAAFAEKSEINKKLQVAYREKSEINQKLQTAYQEKSEINRKLQVAYQEKSEINRKLQITYQEKSEINRKLQAASELNRKQQTELREKEIKIEQIYNSTTYKIGKLILYIPKRIKNFFSKSRNS